MASSATHLLPHTIGHQKATELLLGERQTAAVLHKLGLVNRVVSTPDVLTKALTVAQRMATKSRASAGLNTMRIELSRD